MNEFPSETIIHRDPLAGTVVRQLTNYKGHSHHLYFTNSGWFDRGSRLLFGSDRAGQTNLFSVSLEGGAIVQHTYSDMPGPPHETSFLFCSLNPTRPEAYYWRGKDLLAVDLLSNHERTLYRAQDRFFVNMTSVTADGKYICAGLFEDLSLNVTTDFLHGYAGFRDYWHAKPLSVLMAVCTETGKARALFQEQYWIGHVNTSPTEPHLLIFCHEGPWREIDNRIWGCDMRTGKVWAIRPQNGEGKIGHEYWLQDGVHIAYHGVVNSQPVFGSIAYDNQTDVILPIRPGSRHLFSLDGTLIVGDGWADDILIWGRSGDQLEGPRVLCRHGSSGFIQQTHVHPRLSPDGRQLVFTSDRTGYGNVYILDLPAVEHLPLFREVDALGDRYRRPARRQRAPC